MLLMLSGDRGPRASLLACLREIHDEARENVRVQIEARKAKSIPLDDAADWGVVKEQAALIDASLLSLDSNAARDAASAILEQTRHALRELPEFDASDLDGFESVYVVPRVVSDAEKTRMTIEHDAAWAALVAARDGDDVIACRAKLMNTRAEFVSRAFSSIDGIMRSDGTPVPLRTEDASKIEGVGCLIGQSILTKLYDVGLHFQRLPAKKAARYGLSQP